MFCDELLYFVSSSEVRKSQKTAYKRRRDQNAEISELEALLPWSQTQVKNAGIDKISVLRLTSAYIKFKDFWQSGSDYGCYSTLLVNLVFVALSICLSFCHILLLLCVIKLTVLIQHVKDDRDSIGCHW